MRKRIFLSMVAILFIWPVVFSSTFLNNPPGPEKDINGIYKNDKFELRIINYNAQTSTFSFELNSSKGSTCSIAMEGIATRLALNLSSRDMIRYEYVGANGSRYFFTVYSGENPTVDIMRDGSKGDANDTCLPNQSSTKLSFDTKQ